jgi:hypothetical protein
VSRCVIFCGPSLPEATILRFLPKADVRPPAVCGDVYRAVMQGAVTIGLIDGSAEERGAVWHKEIMFALQQGVFVYGAGGMGALRAADLHRLGMIGVGRVFAWYRDGMTDADDEIMVSYASRDEDYRVQSEALVNIRATLERAVAAWLLSEAEANKLIQVAKTLYYPWRTYASLLEAAHSQQALANETLVRLEEWLTGWNVRLDQKRIDAEAMVRRIANMAHDERFDGSKLDFERTAGWDALTRQVAGDAAASR